MTTVDAADLKVRDVWKQFPPRRVVGSDLTERVGARGWEPPAWARTHARIFARCGVPDPFHPGSEDHGVGLGEVGIAQPKRAPAPHALPPAPKAPAGGAPRFPNVPQAAQRIAPPVPGQQAPSGPAPTGKAAPKIGEVRRDDTADLRKKLGEKERLRADPDRANAFKVQQPVAKIPMRPEGAAPARTSQASAAGGGVGAGGRPAVPTTPGGAPALRPVGAGPRAPMRPYAAPSARPTAPPPPEEIDIEPGDFFGGGRPEAPPRAAATVANAPATVHLPSDRAAGAPVRSANPSVPASPVTRPAPAPLVSPVASAAASSAPARPVASPPAPPNRVPPRSAGGGMDDLFGMGGGDNTRIRMPKAEEAAAKSRRPTVMDPSQVAGGIDRRPPAARPPIVTPSPSSASAPSASDMPEE